MQIYKDVPLEFFQEAFIYDKDTGDLTWGSGRINSGKLAGSFVEANGGYLQLCVSYKGKTKSFQGHRIIWAIHYGVFPDEDLVIDHIDGDVRNNRITNLRLVTQRGNNQNRKKRVVKVNSKYVLTSVQGIKLDKKTLEYVVSYKDELGNPVELRFDDFDSAKYARWDYEYDNNFHVNHSVRE